MTRYLLDANVFIQAKNLHYGFDFCPAFWDWLLQGNRNGVVASVEKVADELLVIDDDLAQWVQERGDAFFLPPDTLAIPLCGRAEQAEVVRPLDEHLEAVDTLQAEIDANLTRAEALRQSILKKAFSGKLVPQDPDDEPAQALLARIRASRDQDSTTKPRRRTRRRSNATAPP